MKKMYLYYLKKRLPALLIITFLLFAITFVYTQITDIWSNYDGYEANRTYLPFLTVIMSSFVSIIAIYEFSYKMKKTSVDLFYSFPITRRKMIVTKYLIALTETLVVFFVLFGFIIAKTYVVNNKYGLNMLMEYHWLYLLFGLICYPLMLGFVSFFFMRGNSVIDGILITTLASLVLLVLMYGCKDAVFHLTHIDETTWDSWVKYRFYFDGSYYTPFSPISVLSSYCNGSSIDNLKENVINPVALPIMFAILAASNVGLFVLNPKIKAENSEDVTNDLFGYKTILPITLFGMMLIQTLGWLLIVIFLIVVFFLYVIKNRSFKLRKDEWITYFLTAGLGIAMNLIIYSIK